MQKPIRIGLAAAAILAVSAAILAVSAGGVLAQCAPGAIGTSRQVEIDSTGAPKFGHLQYPGPDFLKQGEVVLTFDDGPHKQLTPVILATLDQHCAKATFFMLGQRAMMYPDVAREVLRRGHSVGTHTWSHANLRQKSGEAATAEIELGISGVQKALGQPAAPFFRFPYLSDSQSSIAHLKNRNTAMFSIDVDSYDYRTRSPTVAMRNVMQQLKAKGRGIILFHDIQPSTAGALGALLSDLKAGGYKVVHIVPRQQQVTLAEFDRRVGSPSHAVASANIPLARRTVMAPAWEPRVVPIRQSGADGTPHVATAHVGQPPAHTGPVPAPSPTPVRAVAAPPPRPAGEDWRQTIFRGY